MSYIALYRKFRPQDFKDMSGQEVIVKTLENAVKTNKIGHAYVFSGPRGTGKTSLAKIFAKAINCETPVDGNPCNKCASCINASTNSASDIIEIDGASNNGVEEIRDLRDKVKYLPSVGKYKVYIIDEVHMLTTGAFNALLKTLEEPPSHVVFILATTEVHKIPATILSRCQRFDFKNIELKNIIERLNYVAEIEKIEIEDDAVRQIALNAEGGMRDALSLFDQAISFTSDKITEEDVNDIVGSVSRKALVNLLETINNGDVTKALTLVNDFINEGKEEERLIKDLILTLRDLLLNIVNFNNDEIFASFKRNISVNKVYHFLNVLIESENNMRFSVQKQIYLEIAIIQMIEHDDVKQIDLSTNIIELRNEVEKLKKEGIETNSVKKETTKKKALVLIEDILSVLYEANTTDRNLVEERINNSGSEAHLEMISHLLKNSEVAAASLNSVIITNENIDVCNELMQSMNHELVKEIINNGSDDYENVYVILKNDWDTVRSRYVELLRSGQKRPIISKYDFKIYEEVKEVVSQERSEVTKLAEEFFGSDIVNIKE